MRQAFETQRVENPSVRNPCSEQLELELKCTLNPHAKTCRLILCSVFYVQSAGQYLCLYILVAPVAFVFTHGLPRAGCLETDTDTHNSSWCGDVNCDRSTYGAKMAEQAEDGGEGGIEFVIKWNGADHAVVAARDETIADIKRRLGGANPAMRTHARWQASLDKTHLAWFNCLTKFLSHRSPLSAPTLMTAQAERLPQSVWVSCFC